MKLVSFRYAGSNRLGLMNVSGSAVIDLTKVDPSIPSDILEFIELGDEGLNRLRCLSSASEQAIPLSDVKLLAPIPQPRRNIFCIGKNYRDHLQEVATLPDGGQGEPESPIVFTKATTAVIGVEEPIPASSDPTGSCDYEGELAVVIGQGGKGITRAAAMAHVYGYTIINDVTSRRLQAKHHQWFLGKSLDGFCPMGPVLLTADEVADVGSLIVETHVNGELRQQGKVGSMIFDIPALIEAISALVTLLPGDIIATGTPAGVGAGRRPPVFLQPGDQVEICIDPIGVLTSPVA